MIGSFYLSIGFWRKIIVPCKILEMHQVLSFQPSQQRRISSSNNCILCLACTSFYNVRQVQVCQWHSLINYFQQKHTSISHSSQLTKFYKLTTNTKKYFQSFSALYMLGKKRVWQQRLFFIPSPSFKFLSVVPVLTGQVWVLFFFVANCWRRWQNYSY